MQNDLVMNKLPLPKYFDGQNWNTVIKPTRKCIPKYLHEDLPQLKHIYIKEKFKEIGKFNCPEIDYFSTMIRHKKPPVEKKQTKKKQNITSYQQLKQQLQYALIMTDINSNIVDDLLNKVKKAEGRNKKLGSEIKKKKRSNSLYQKGKYFGNTVDLVFRQRKKQYINNQKKGQEVDTKDIEDKINEIKLLDFQT